MHLHSSNKLEVSTTVTEKTASVSPSSSRGAQIDIINETVSGKLKMVIATMFINNEINGGITCTINSSTKVFSQSFKGMNGTFIGVLSTPTSGNIKWFHTVGIAPTGHATIFGSLYYFY